VGIVFISFDWTQPRQESMKLSIAGSLKNETANVDTGTLLERALSNCGAIMAKSLIVKFLSVMKMNFGCIRN
jgi:hypothetical protein